MIERHRDLTASPRAAWILENWDATLPKFLKVYPHELKRVQNTLRAKEVSDVPQQLPGVLVSIAAGAEQVRHG
jgi:glutamate synthase (NADPH/NADH) large chain